MRKIMINVSASSVACWSAGALFLWIRREKTAWIGFGWIGLTTFSVGVLLLLFVTMLLILRSILLDQALKKRGLKLSFFDMFRKIEWARPYQRDFWMQGSLILTLPLLVLLGLLGHQIMQHSLLTPTTTLRDQEYLVSCMTLTIYLALPLSVLLYALVSKDIADVLPQGSK